MASEKQSYSMGLIGLPSVCIAVGWLALWLIWPSNGTRRVRYQVPDFRVAYVELDPASADSYRAPSPFVSESSSQRLKDELITDVLLRTPERPPRFLSDRIELIGPLAPETRPALHEEAHRRLGGYDPAFRGPTVFSSSTNESSVVLVQLSGSLAACGFTVPPLPVDEFRKTARAWGVTVHVTIDTFGRPEHIFLEKGCDDPRINDIVIRKLYQGKAAETGTPVRGTVTVNFGTR